MNWSSGPLVAEAYDAKAPLGHTYGDVEYYVRHLGEVSGKILEVGSGTGRILIRLLQAGKNVEGLEQSMDMIRICRRYCRSLDFKPELHEGDMSSFVNPMAYSAVIVPAGAINSLDGRAQTRRALDCFLQSMTADGRLIVDLEIPGRRTGDRSVRLWRKDNTVWTVETVHTDFEPVRNQTIDYVKYEKWVDGCKVGAELHTFRTQHWTPEEFIELLRGAGFVDVRVSANYDDRARPGVGDRDWSFHGRKQ